MTYEVNIMKKLVHLSKPGVCILVSEICSHGKHDVIRSSNVGLQIPRRHVTTV